MKHIFIYTILSFTFLNTFGQITFQTKPNIDSSQNYTRFVDFSSHNIYNEVAIIKKDTMYIKDSLGLIKVLLKIVLDSQNSNPKNNLYFKPLVFSNIKFENKK